MSFQLVFHLFNSFTNTDVQDVWISISNISERAKAVLDEEFKRNFDFSVLDSLEENALKQNNRQTLRWTAPRIVQKVQEQRCRILLLMPAL